MLKPIVEFYVTNLKKDIKILIKNKFHQRTHDLMNMVFYEDIPELIKFMEKVNKAFDGKSPEASGQYAKGYRDAIEDLKREIYETK